jgi:hypothetical protein
MKCLAECFFVLVAALKSLFVGSAIEARSIAPVPARRKFAATIKGKPGDAIRRLRVVARCTPSEVVNTVPEGNA